MSPNWWSSLGGWAESLSRDIFDAPECSPRPAHRGFGRPQPQPPASLRSTPTTKFDAMSRNGYGVAVGRHTFSAFSHMR